MSCSFGEKVKIQIFGQSHSQGIGVVIDGLPAGKPINEEKILQFLARRQGGNSDFATARKEKDIPQILSGILDGKTCGAPISAVFENKDIRSGDYTQFQYTPRPAHADYVAHIKYHGANDIRGGGHFSGRMTLPLCFAGAICKQLLEEQGIYIGAHIASIGQVADEPFDWVELAPEQLNRFARDSFPVNNQTAKDQMLELIAQVKSQKDSIGGSIECGIIGMPVGIGEPMFDGLENKISQIVFGIPGIKGIEFGAGFQATTMLGSEHNDAFVSKNKHICTQTNNAGGILGGISTGMPIIFRVAVKPTPSIALSQKTLNITTGKLTDLEIKGRHDPCIVPRAVVCVEAAAAIGIYNLI